MNISLYRCFSADQRLSMDVYADGLENALEVSGLNMEIFKPASTLERFNDNAWVMRYLRYYSYASQVKKHKQNNNVHHVTDHGYAHLLTSLKSGVKVLTVHDLIPFLTWKGVIKKQDGDHFFKRKPRLNLYSLKFIKAYDHIVTLSASTAHDLITYLNIPKELITVIPPVIGRQYVPASDGDVQLLCSKYHLDRDTKWLMVSGREYYKNHSTGLLVLKELLKHTDKPIKLIKTGMPSPEFDLMVTELGLETSVKSVFLDDINELPALYSFVDCLLFPSLYEGFGMPVAEALACGTPVVMSDRASLPEAGGELALQCDAFDVQSLARAVSSQLNSEVKNRIFNRGPLWVTRFGEHEIGK